MIGCIESADITRTYGEHIVTQHEFDVILLDIRAYVQASLKNTYVVPQILDVV